MKLIENKRDILVFFNEKNVLKSPITLTNDHIKSEFIALRRHKKTISVGICRCSDQSLLTDTSIQHISSLTYDEFQKLSIDHSSTPSLNESRKSLTITDEIITTTTDLKAVSIKHKAIIEQHKPLIHKRSASPNRDSGFIETDGTNTSMLTDRSVISNSHTKHRSKASLEKSEDESTDTHKSLDSLQQSITKTTSEPIKKKPSGLIYSLQKRDKHVPNQTDLPVQTVTDACFIYRREVVKPDPNIVDENSAIVQRGREIAYEAANAPSIPPSMPNYSRDQIRELYGELDKKTRRLQEDEYTLHSPVSNSSNEKHQWKLASPKNAKKPISCPMPKFRLEKPADNDEALLMAAYLSTGITNPRMKPNIPIDSFHTVMMNASAKVNEWAHNNEIYLAPVSKSMISNNFHATTDNHSTINPTPLLFDVHFNIKQSAGTPTGNNSNRPTFLEIIEQESISNTNQPTDNNDENFRTLKRQSNTTDTISSSPDLNDIALETTPSTPGSCGMYLEPYMRRGYDLPCLDHNIRDSSWQHSDHDDGDEATLSLKTMTPIESPVSPKFDTNIDSMPPMTSNVVDSDSLVDLDDGTTVSYYSAKESRIDTTNHSTLSVGSDETISSLQQNPIRDDIINNFISPEDNYYFDALASPSHTNQQTSSSSSVTTSVDKQNLLIDNLANLLEEIETFNHTSHQLLSRVDEESSQLSHEEEESSNRIDRVITVVDNVHQYNQIESMDSMNNLLFVYDDIDVEQPDSSINNLVEIVHTIHQAPVVINNLLFVYDETVTPSDGESKTIINGSSEWSYDNLMNHQDETDNLGFVVHEALTSKLQKSPKYEETRGSGEAMTDNLGFVVHEALTGKIKKSPKYEQTNKREESTADTDSLSTLVHTVLSSKLQKPTNPVIYETVEPIADNDNLITVVDEVLTTNFQKLMPVKSTAELDQSVPRETYSEFIDYSLFDTSIPEDLEKSTDGYNQESISFNDEQTDDTHTSEILTYEIEQPNQQSIAFPVINLSQIVSDTLLTGSNYHQYKNNFESNITRQPEYDEEIYEEYGYRRTTTDSSSNDIVDRHEELCRRYLSSCKQYQTTTEKLDNEIDQFEKHLIAQKPQLLSPTSDVTSEELITTIERIVDMRNESATNRNETDDYCSTITVQRQPDDYGKYGFDFEELFDGKIQISNILDENYCHNMNIGDEIISINNDRTFKTREECQQVFDSLWKSGYENIPITVIKSVHIPIVQGK
ncbi:unnamed protein product [Rotaria socialis]|uniref:PDZ domain-containing protein n=1 Tax=Rotaria socialis TaxID=392032 RepID=A0A820VX19_9BILA|nr:unnamed protein product [Rotaria socialis]CAF4507572.1 unnamed protein product [Rotaria socialis]